MFSHLKNLDANTRRKEIMDNIGAAYREKVKHKVQRVQHKNVLLIGRTRTGKSTLKQLLVDPTTISEELTLASQTKNATFESFIIDDNQVVINIIDTPGLFERGTDENQVRDNQAILRTIEQCIEREITKFHLVGFCASFESGINDQDVKAIRELIDFLGQGVSKNSCLIVTRCESKSQDQRQKLMKEIETDMHFKPLAGYFKQGIFFSGCLHRDSWMNATDDLYTQFETIVGYRERLIEVLTKNIEPFMVQESSVSRLRQLIEEQEKLKKQIEELQAKGEQDEALIGRYKAKLSQKPCFVQ
ncbi:unnamed protein product [Rotaria sp. Silwood2]|nr:unnamed protein product [Rotaria sp. Silwood2]CAF4544618.1 unnamed protein product [Rotaria sp. Silwood2]